MREPPKNLTAVPKPRKT